MPIVVIQHSASLRTYELTTNSLINEVEYFSCRLNKTMMNNILIRQMPVFISSTFQDMMPERDFLINKTFPKLRELASKRNVEIIPVDLRWGITEEDSKSGKVIEVCLDEIVNSHPYHFLKSQCTIKRFPGAPLMLAALIKERHDNVDSS